MGSGLGYVIYRLESQQRADRAVAEGVLSLLRESIVTNYNNYTERGCCPIHAKESLRHVYEAYHNLGGNDVATKLYHTLLEMPEEEPEEKEGIWKQQTSFTPYLLGKAILTSFPVYLVSTGGWEKLHEIWLRTAFKEKGETH